MSCPRFFFCMKNGSICSFLVLPVKKKVSSANLARVFTPTLIWFFFFITQRFWTVGFVFEWLKVCASALFTLGLRFETETMGKKESLIDQRWRQRPTPSFFPLFPLVNVFYFLTVWIFVPFIFDSVCFSSRLSDPISTLWLNCLIRALKWARFTLSSLKKCRHSYITNRFLHMLLLVQLHFFLSFNATNQPAMFYSRVGLSTPATPSLQ